MSASDSITFHCPACHTRLTVPASLAGVTGPCPSCQVTIRAPYPESPAPLPQSSQALEPTPQKPQQPLYAPPASHHQRPLGQTQQQAPQIYPQQPTELQQATQAPPAILRPEPRELPNRSEPVVPVTRQRSEPTGDRRALTSTPSQPPQRHHRSRILRFAVPALFIALVLGVVFGVKTFLQKDRIAAGGGVTASEDKVRIILPEEESDTFDSLTEVEDNGILPTEPLQMPTAEQSPQDVPPEYLPVDGGIAALEVLEKFLAMGTLEERLPHLESKLSKAELASSVINGSLPEVLKITVDIRETNPIEQLIDYYYHVDFDDGNGGQNLQTMLVRTRGGGAPVVVVDPFIDLFGGRFEEYAKSPKTEAGTFQVIISAGAFCYDDVPGAEKKFTLKILAREDAKEIAKAYFGRRSKIGDMLEDETSGLAYGQAKACTVFMRWNNEEDPQKPFLEALDLKALNWNP